MQSDVKHSCLILIEIHVLNTFILFFSDLGNYAICFALKTSCQHSAFILLLLKDWLHPSTTMTSQNDERLKRYPGVELELMVSKIVCKLSKRVSKLKSDSKSSSSFHSSVNSSNEHRHAIHKIFSTLLYFFDLRSSLT